MNELTREELDARFGTIETRIDARFTEAQARTDAKFAEAQARTDVKFAEAQAWVSARFAEAQARTDAKFESLIKWMVGTAIAATATGIAALTLLMVKVAPRTAAPIVITLPAPASPAAAK